MQRSNFDSDHITFLNKAGQSGRLSTDELQLPADLRLNIEPAKSGSFTPGLKKRFFSQKEGTLVVSLYATAGS